MIRVARVPVDLYIALIVVKVAEPGSEVVGSVGDILGVLQRGGVGRQTE
jgi:hypothetical protein